jgi:hypothetical protein
MSTYVISLRLPACVTAALGASAAAAHLSVSGTLDWLLRYSVGSFELLRGLADCPERRNRKLDARISVQTGEQLKLASQKLGISISVYARTLLYHFYITKRVCYVKSEGRYTLAARYD